MKFIMLAISKCRAKEADGVVKHNATKNVVVGCVKIDMVTSKVFLLLMVNMNKKVIWCSEWGYDKS